MQQDCEVRRAEGKGCNSHSRSVLTRAGSGLEGDAGWESAPASCTRAALPMAKPSYRSLQLALAEAENVVEAAKQEEAARLRELKLAQAALADAHTARARALETLHSHPSHVFGEHSAGPSPFMLILGINPGLRLITDHVEEDDALCLALTCRPMRDAIFARFPSRSLTVKERDMMNEGRLSGELESTTVTARIRTRDASIVSSVSRLKWACQLPEAERPDWLMYASMNDWHAPVTYRVVGGGGVAALEWALAATCHCDRCDNLDEDDCNDYYDEYNCGHHPFCCLTKEVAITSYGACRAAEAGHLSMLQWLSAEGHSYWKASACAGAAAGGHLEVLQWCRRQGCAWNPVVRSMLNQPYVHLHMEGRRCHSNGCHHNGTPGEDFEQCAPSCQLHLRPGAVVCSLAAWHGHLHVLQWAHAEGCEMDASVCSSAADGGHLELLRWACAQGCVPDSRACFFAAEMGHLAVLQWLRHQGCPWDRAKCLRACRHYNAEGIKAWIEAQPE